MEKYKVNVLERFPSPLFWNEFRGKNYILNSNEREINGKGIEIENDPKTKIIVFGSWNPYACDYESYKAKKERDERIRCLLPMVRKGIRKRKIQENIAFNKSLNIPVKWSSEVKQVLSGLSENSNGCGTKKNTVLHVYLHEVLKSGRLSRESNSYLCTQVEARWNGNWSGTIGTNKLERRVTCKSCLKIAKRFN